MLCFPPISFSIPLYRLGIMAPDNPSRLCTGAFTIWFVYWIYLLIFCIVVFVPEYILFTIVLSWFILVLLMAVLPELPVPQADINNIIIAGIIIVIINYVINTFYFYIFHSRHSMFLRYSCTYLYDLSKIPAHSSSDISQGFARNKPPIVSLAFTARVMDSSGLKP